MAITNKTIEVGGEWAKDAPQTPTTPVDGNTYANGNITEADINDGFKYNTIADSSDFNEVMRRMTKIMRMLESYGIMPWYYGQTYSTGSHCVGSNGKIYRCILEHSNQDPISTSGYWICDIDTTVSDMTDLVSAEAIARAAADSSHASTVNAHSATSAATASRIIQRDANGRAKVAAPSASDDIARLDTVTAHTSLYDAHGATVAATADRIIKRDSNGRSQIASPIASSDIMDLLTHLAHTNLTSTAHGGTSSPNPNTQMSRDASGRTQVATPSAGNDAVNLTTLNNHVNATAGAHGSTVYNTPNTIPLRDPVFSTFNIGQAVTGVNPIRQDQMVFDISGNHGRIGLRLQYTTGALYTVYLQWNDAVLLNNSAYAHAWIWPFAAACHVAWACRASNFDDYNEESGIAVYSWTAGNVTISSEMSGYCRVFGIGW